MRLYIVLAGEDHPKACTGRRLLHRGLARAVNRVEGIVPPPIVLDPYAEEPLGPADANSAARGGILAVDCSWNRLSERGRFPGEASDGRGRGIRRRLPILIATNPQHYGRPAQLNTVEALAAALVLVGRGPEATRLLEGFSGADAFLRVNEDRLETYRHARGAEAVRSAERRLFGGDAVG
ncbi:MAG: ribosome biogenesis domain-containing protein [Thermoplasmata archaeon]